MTDSRALHDRPSASPGAPAARLRFGDAATRVMALAAATLLLLQAYTFMRVVALSLGPRVILQPWLIAQHGFLMYDQLPDQHTPLMPVLLSLAAPFFSEGWRAARAVLVLLLSLTGALTFIAARRDGGAPAALAATATFVCWSVAFEFGKLWHESFLAPLYLLLFLLDRPLSRGGGRWRLAASGLVCGLAFLVKQTAVEVIAVVVLWHLVKSWRARAPIVRQLTDLAVLGAAALACPVAWVAVHLAQGGTMDAVWFWVFRFNRDSGFLTTAALAPTRSQLLALAPAYLLVPVATWVAVNLARAGDPRCWRYLHATLLLAATSLGAYPRYGAFHLAPSLPFIAWMSGMVFCQASRASVRGVRIVRRAAALSLVLAVALVWAVSGLGAFSRASATRPRPIEQYTDVQPLADAVKQHVSPGDSIYVFPDDEAIANVYYLLQVPPPRFWMFHYPWYMMPSVSTRVLHAFAGAEPTWVIHQGDPWGIESLAPGVFSYLRSHYDVISTVRWSGHDVQIMKRRPVAPGAGGEHSPSL